MEIFGLAIPGRGVVASWGRIKAVIVLTLLQRAVDGYLRHIYVLKRGISNNLEWQYQNLKERHHLFSPNPPLRT